MWDRTGCTFILTILFVGIEFEWKVRAIIPNVCVQNVTRHEGLCCPISRRTGRVCGGPGFGHCEKVYPPRETVSSAYVDDDRISWPLRFFKYACECEGNHFGIACDECWFGWEGSNCDERQFTIRRDIRSLSDRQLYVFKDVVARSGDWPSGYSVLDESTNYRSDPLYKPRFTPVSVQYWAAFLHRYGARPTLFDNTADCEKHGALNFNHEGTAFPTWHRYFQLMWERMLAEIALEVHHIHGFSIPYWDPIGLESCDICNNRYIGSSGRTDKDGTHLSERSPFHKMKDYCLEPQGGAPCFGCQATGRQPTITRKFLNYFFPTQDDVLYTLSMADYHVPGDEKLIECISFHRALEGFCGQPGTNNSFRWMHNRLHLMIDGSMCCTSTATNDPIFMLYHQFIDKLFNIWLRIHHPDPSDFPASGVHPGHSRNSFMIALVPLARNIDMFVDSKELGYDYDDKSIAKYSENNQPVIIFD